MQYIIKRSRMIEGDFYLATVWQGIAPVFIEDKTEAKKYDLESGKYWVEFLKNLGFETELLTY